MEIPVLFARLHLRSGAVLHRERALGRFESGKKVYVGKRRNTMAVEGTKGFDRNRAYFPAHLSDSEKAQIIRAVARDFGQETDGPLKIEFVSGYVVRHPRNQCLVERTAMGLVERLIGKMTGDAAMRFFYGA